MSVATGRLSDKYPLRLEDGLRDKIKEIATRNRRSMNAEINLRLIRSLEAEGETIQKSERP